MQKQCKVGHTRHPAGAGCSGGGGCSGCARHKSGRSPDTRAAEQPSSRACGAHVWPRWAGRGGKKDAGNRSWH